MKKRPKNILYKNQDWLYREYWVKGRSTCDIAKQFGVSPENIASIMNRRNIPRRSRVWSRGEDKKLRVLAKRKTFKEIAKLLNRSYDAVRIRAIKLGIKSVYSPGEETKKKEIRKKISSSLQGILPENWNGFKESKNALIRKSEPYQKWRWNVFIRDNFSCVKCKNGGYLNADHIKPFALFPKLRFEVSNGQTLCIDCHKLKTKQDIKTYENENTVL